MKRQSYKKRIDELAEKVALFEARLLKAKTQKEEEGETEEEGKERLQRNAKKIDPRKRYQDNKAELWFHPSVLKHDEECSEYLEEELGAYICEHYDEDPIAVQKYSDMKWACIHTYQPLRC